MIEPVLTLWRAARPGPGINQPVHDLREIVNAIFYVTQTGIAGEYYRVPPTFGARSPRR